jgi:hypothetical protein
MYYNLWVEWSFAPRKDAGQYLVCLPPIADGYDTRRKDASEYRLLFYDLNILQKGFGVILPMPRNPVVSLCGVRQRTKNHAWMR